MAGSDVASGVWHERLTQDVREAVRSLRRRWAFTALVIPLLGGAVGLNAAIFAVVDAALFKGFRHVQRNEQLVRLSTTQDVIYYPDYVAWRDQSRSLTDIVLVRGVFHTLRAGEDGAQTVFTTEVTPNTFRLLGVMPALGRDFQAADALPGAEPVVMLRHDVWTRRFQGAADVVGRRIPLDGVATTVIGVMPAGFSFPAEQEIWTPLVPTAAALARETPYARYAYGRLGDGASLAAARVELETIGQRLAQARPATRTEPMPTVAGFEDWFVGRQSRALYLGVWGAAACVLLIVCGNIANLFVLQAIHRHSELRVRQALGASTARLVVQVALEIAVLAVASAALAWWVADLGLTVLRASAVFAPTLSVDIDIVTFGYVWALCAAAACAIGGAAALQLIGRRNVTLLGPSRTVAGSARAARLVDGFVGLQVALAIVLLVSAGLLTQMLVRVTNASAGVAAEGVVTASLYLPPERYAGGDARFGFYRELSDRVSSDQSVAGVGFAEVPPTSRTPRRDVDVAESQSGGSGTSTATVVVSPGFFRAVGAAIVEGRDTQWTDGASSTAVLVNQRFAARHWPNGSAIGRRLRFSPTGAGGPPGAWLTVVGVTSDIVQNDVTRQALEPIVYVPYGHRPQANMFVFARARAATGPTAAAIRESVFALDPALPLPSLAPLETRLSQAHTLERQAAATLGSFSTLALVVAAVGIYAVIGQAVTRRTRELGVRIAVGATPRHIVGAVATGELRSSAVGAVVGLALSAGAARFIGTHVAGVQQGDPLVVIVALAVLLVAVAGGCWWPVRRALRIAPATILRQE